MLRSAYSLIGVSLLALCQIPCYAYANDVDAISKYVKYQSLKKQYKNNYMVFAAKDFDPLSQNNALKIISKIRDEIDFNDYDKINYFIDGQRLSATQYNIYDVFADLPYELFDNAEVWAKDEKIEISVPQFNDLQDIDNNKPTPAFDAINIIEPKTVTKNIRALNVNINTRHIVVFAARPKNESMNQYASLLRFNSRRNYAYASDKLKTDFTASLAKPVISYDNSTNLDSNGGIENRKFNSTLSQSSLSQFSAVYSDKIGDNDLTIGAKTKTSISNSAWNYSTMASGDSGAIDIVNSNNFGIGNKVNSKSEFDAAYLFKIGAFDAKFAVNGNFNNIDEQYENSYNEDDTANFDVAYYRSRYYEFKSSALFDRSVGTGKISLGNDYVVRKLVKQKLYGESGSSNLIVALQPSTRTDVEEIYSNLYAKTKFKLASKLSLDAKLGLIVGNTYNQDYDINNNIVYYVPDIKIEYAKDAKTTLRASFKRDFSNFYYGAFAFLGNVNSGSDLTAEKINIAELELQRKFGDDAEFKLEFTNQFTPNKIGQVPVYTDSVLSGQTLANGLDENIANVSANIKYPLVLFNDKYQFQSRFDFGVQTYADVFDNVSGDRINTNRRVAEIYLTRKNDNSDINWGAYYKSSAGKRYFSYDEAVIVPSNSTLGMFVNYNLNSRADFVVEVSTPIDGDKNVIITKYDIEKNDIDYVNVRPLSDASVKLTIKSKI